ncbi:MAG: hypothetical protein JSR61_11835 [Proteobacteria bacterium]|nr:hypothetical protein [Pseudomonadota bacterium]
MIRFLLRALGLFGLAAAFVLVIYDGTKSIAGNRLFLTSVGDLWTLINAKSLAAIQPLVSPYANGVLWDPVAKTFLSWPAWAVLGVIAILFLLLGRPRRPLIGYAR